MFHRYGQRGVHKSHIPFAYESYYTTNMKSFLRVVPPPLVAIVLVLVMEMIVSFAKWMAVVFLLQELLAYVFFVVGFIFMMWSVVLLAKAGTTLNPNKKPSALITNGPYLVSRNPMYLSWNLIMIGYAFLRGIPLLFLAPLLFCLVMDRTVVPHEESLMRKQIGSTFDRYANSVPRWL